MYCIHALYCMRTDFYMIMGKLMRLNSSLKHVSHVVCFLILVTFHRLECGRLYEWSRPLLLLRMIQCSCSGAIANILDYYCAWFISRTKTIFYRIFRYSVDETWEQWKKQCMVAENIFCTFSVWTYYQFFLKSLFIISLFFCFLIWVS